VSSIASSIARLTETILGKNNNDLVDNLRAIASEIGLRHIAYLRLSPDSSVDVRLLVAVVTYSRSWQHRYFTKKYATNDPVINFGQGADQPFDWGDLAADDATTKAFFADALMHDVGRNGLSIPLRNRRSTVALVSFTSDLSKDEWETYKASNMESLELLAILVDAASYINFKLAASTVHLSGREEQCLLWAARGKTYHEIAEILGLAFGSVKSHLYAARHKLHCMNLTHAVAVALATGVIPAQALK
jgi:LuxR family transcriptional regulator, quorum-sensing system regulator RaiR